jgi:hypothetical protein
MFARSLGFAGLLLGGGAALAEPAPAPPAADHAAIASPDAKEAGVDARFSVRTAPNRVEVALAVVNASDRAREVLVRRGSSGGASVHVTAIVDGERIGLERVMDESARRETMSRMGPMPTYATVEAGKQADLGTTAFVLPRGADPSTVRVEARVFVDGDAIPLSWAPAPASS